MISTRNKRDGGFAHWSNGDLGVKDIEKSTITCCHCNRVVFLEPLKPVEDFTGWCMSCFKFVCLRCAALGECRPLERQLERMERAHR